MRKIAIRRPACLLSFIFTITVWLILNISGGVDVKEYMVDGENVALSGYISDKSNKNDRNILYIRKCNSRSGYGIVVYLSEQDMDVFKIGQKVTVSGKYLNYELPENQGQFNMRQYYRIKGYEGCIRKATVISDKGSYSHVKNALFNIKKRTGNIYDCVMPPEYSGTMKALVLGDKDNLSSDVKELYQDAGIAHVLALSGLHVATVGMTLLNSLIKTGIGIAPSSIISSVIMVLYGIMTGLSVSTIRALIMFLLGVLAKTAGRTYDLLSAVSVSSMLILVENPYYVYDSGFLLSVLAVLGIAVIYPIISPYFKYKLWKSMCVSMSATIGTLPVTMCSFYKISRYGIITNLLVVPLAGVILFIGITSGFIGNLLWIMNHKKMNIVNIILLKVAEYLLRLYGVLAGTTVKLKGNTWVTGTAESWQLFVYIMLICAAVYVAYLVDKNKTDSKPVNRLRKFIPGLLIAFAIIILSVRSKSQLEIHSISVGQGSCNLITGKNLPVMMVDGGSTDIKDVYKYRIEPVLLYNGINNIDYLFVTHADTDHISGIVELLSDNVETVHVTNLILGRKNDELIALAKAKGINTVIMSKGDHITSEMLDIECLNPVSLWDIKSNKQNTEEDINEDSLVICITHKRNGYKAMFTGDIGVDTEKRILNYVNQVDYLTVPHHGSRYSSSKEFLIKANPRVCTISAGKNNSYGHPHNETLERLQQFTSNARVFRTDESGQITVRVNENRANIERFVH